MHLGVLIGFAVNGDLQRLGRRHRGLGVEQVQVAKGVHHFLGSSFFKGAGLVFVAGFTGQLGEIAVLDMCHGLADKGRLKVGDGFNFGALWCGHRGLLGFKQLANRSFQSAQGKWEGQSINKTNYFFAN